MSSDLKAILKQVAEEDYENKELEIEENLLSFKSVLLEIAKAKKWGLAIWVEETELQYAKRATMSTWYPLNLQKMNTQKTRRLYSFSLQSG